MLSFLVWLLTESKDKEDNETTGEESEEEEQIKSGSEDEEQEVNKSEQKTNVNRKRQINSDDPTDEERNERKCGDSPKEMVKNKASTTKNGETGSSNTSQGKKTPQSDKENDSDMDNLSERSDKIKGNDSSDDSDKGEYANLILTYQYIHFYSLILSLFFV